MPEGLMSKDSRQNRVQNHGILRAFHLGGGKKGGGTLCRLSSLLMQSFYSGKLAIAAEAQSGLLNLVILTGYGPQSQTKVSFSLLYVTTFRIPKDNLPLGIAVVDSSALDFWDT